jgi:hypothetical protein
MGSLLLAVMPYLTGQNWHFRYPGDKARVVIHGEFARIAMMAQIKCGRTLTCFIMCWRRKRWPMDVARLVAARVWKERFNTMAWFGSIPRTIDLLFSYYIRIRYDYVHVSDVKSLARSLSEKCGVGTYVDPSLNDSIVIFPTINNNNVAARRESFLLKCSTDPGHPYINVNNLIFYHDGKDYRFAPRRSGNLKNIIRDIANGQFRASPNADKAEIRHLQYRGWVQVNSL